MINLDEILVEDESAPTFYCLTNADGKCWVMPAKGMRTAMHLYQPSGAKGKLLKTLFPLLHPLPHVRRILHTRPIHYRLTAKLQALVDELFGRGAAFALFGGTPCVHQKATLQLSRDGRILGYLKLCNHPGVFQLFDHEQQILTELQQKNVTGIPRCLGCGALEDGLWYFAQSTEKTGQSRVLHDWTPLHTEFITSFIKRTSSSGGLKESDIFLALQNLRLYLPKMKEEDSVTVKHALNFITNHLSNQEFLLSYYHGDFTPWNCYSQANKLYVFDFEYAKRKAPIYMDAVHYFVQHARLELKMKETEAYDYLRKEMNRHCSILSESESIILIMIYSLYQLSFYYTINEGNFHVTDSGYLFLIKLINSCKYTNYDKN